MYSCEDRSKVYAQSRSYYLFGTDSDDNDQPFNKINPHIDLLTSFLFSAESTKFATAFPPEVPIAEYAKVPAATSAIHNEWNSSGADLVFMNSLEWAMVYNTTYVKWIWRGGPSGSLFPFMVEPQCMGVYREDVVFTDRQEAICHKFWTTRSQLENDIANHPNKGRILKAVMAERREPQYELSGLDRVIIISTSPTLQGNTITPMSPREEYKAKVNEDLVEMYELWIWDDEVDDYRVVTQTTEGVTVYDRPNFFVAHEHPFVQVCPFPMYSYYWGQSLVQGLVGLQQWRNERVNQIRSLMARQVRPPTSITGAYGIPDELDFALNRPGGLLSMGEMTAKVEQHKPDVPDDLFREITEIDAMFEERSGIQGILMGKGEKGVRSGRQTSELARLGSARVKKRALIVEDSLEKLATLGLKCMARQLDESYLDENGQKFILKQLPDKFTVKVDGHSNSPLFSEDQKQMADDLLEKGCIDKRTYIEMVDPPGRDMILSRLPALEKQQQEAKKAAEDAKIQEAEAKHGGPKGPSKVTPIK